jgi:hypothetical protein
LWLAVKIMPPVVFLFLIRCDTAGVDSSPWWPTITLLTCRTEHRLPNMPDLTFPQQWLQDYHVMPNETKQCFEIYIHLGKFPPEYTASLPIKIQYFVQQCLSIDMHIFKRGTQSSSYTTDNSPVNTIPVHTMNAYRWNRGTTR